MRTRPSTDAQRPTRARGIGQLQAVAILIHAFASDIVERIARRR